MKTQLPNLLGAVARDYFTDHLPCLRGTSPHTIHSYRDSFVLLSGFSPHAGIGLWRNSTWRTWTHRESWRSSPTWSGSARTGLRHETSDSPPFMHFFVSWLRRIQNIWT